MLAATTTQPNTGSASLPTSPHPVLIPRKLYRREASWGWAMVSEKQSSGLHAAMEVQVGVLGGGHGS